MSSTIIGYGEALWDLLPSGPVLGGAPLNFAYRMNTLGHRSIIASRLGRDDFGQKAHEQITALGMEDICLQWDDTHPTGTVKVHFDSDKNPDYTIIENVAYDFIEFTTGLADIAKGADCLCFGTLAQRNSFSRRTLNQLISGFSGRYRLLDINLRKNCYSEETIAGSLEQADILKLNDEELALLETLLDLKGSIMPDRAADLLRRAELEYCVVTLGKKGVFALSKSGEQVYSPGYDVDLVDPCGSGDAFTAGFIHSLLQNKPLSAACRLGNALGAMVAQQEGATRPVSYEEITAFMDKNHPANIDENFSDLIDI